jgi:hypothetical protein
MSRTVRPKPQSETQILRKAAPQTSPVRHLHQVELARRWNISPRTLENWRWLGQGPAYLKVGGRVLYRIEDVEAFEAASLQASASPAGAKRGSHG